MAKSVQERCDKILGQKEGSDYFAAIAGRKEGEETLYSFGVYFTLPGKMKNTGDADLDKICLLWAKRMTSADNAGLPAKIKSGDMTSEEAAKVLMSYNGEAFLERLNEVKERAKGEPKGDSTETLAVKYLANVLKTKHADGKLADAKVPVPRADNPPMTEKGKVNFIAWAKEVKAADHPWYTQAYKKVAPTEKGFD